MEEKINVIKATGDIEPFSETKVINSLLHAGASQQLAQKILEQIKPQLYQNIPTFQIYSVIMKLLQLEKRELAAKYNIKMAIMEFGPTGYPFEKYVAGVLEKNGFGNVQTNQKINGKCVSHEIDIICNNDKKFMVECKFHTIPGGRTDIKVALYTYARFLDIKEKGFDVPWLITNTKVTQDVKTYAGCIGMKVTAWEYPAEESLNLLIDRCGLYPITAVLDLNDEEKKSLLDQGIIFEKDLKHA